MLEKLERGNLLMVPLDDRRHWYRYHHLFRDFLRQRLYRESPEMVSELHQKACVWREDNGSPNETIGHAFAAGDFEKAADLIERLADLMLGRGETPMIASLIKVLPDEIIRARPRIYIKFATYVMMTGDGNWDAAEAALRDAEQMLGIEGIVEPSKESPVEVNEGEERVLLAGDVATARANIAYEGRGDLRSAIALNRRAVELLDGYERRSARAVAAVNLSECLLDIGDLPAASRAIDEAIKISLAVESAAAEVCCSQCLLGRLQTIQGHLSESMKTYERVLRLTAQHDEAGILLEKGLAHVRIGELLFEWNDLEAATRHLSEGIEFALEWVGLGVAASRLFDVTGTHDRRGTLEQVDADAAHGVVPGYIALARVRLAQGDAEGTSEALRKLEWVAHNSHLSPLRKDRTERWRDLWQARLWIAEGNLRAADRWAQGRELRSTDEIDFSSEVEYTTLARLLLAQGKHEEAANLLGRLMEASKSGGRRHAMIELLVLKTLVLRARNDPSGALSTLRRVLTLAEPEGYVRTFADEGEPMADLLKQLLKSWRSEPPNDFPLEYVGRLLEALGAGTTVPARAALHGNEGPIPDPMTERELEVLRLLDSDLSNREISARLFVALDTVKSHTRHIYAKLGVHNRHQAVAKARDLELL